MKIGIFGGSFNPPHLTHKKIAIDLINNNYVDRVIFVPTGDKYNKKNLINSYYRINMIKEMIKDCDKLFISDYEVKGELKYTYETLKYFKEKFNNDDIYFICGADNLSYIDKWKNYEEILSKYKIIVLNRDKIIEETRYDLDYITNTLVVYFYTIKKSSNKELLWSCFGDIIVENLKKNVKDKICPICGKRFEPRDNTNTVYCSDECYKLANRQKAYVRWESKS